METKDKKEERKEKEGPAMKEVGAEREGKHNSYLQRRDGPRIKGADVRGGGTLWKGRGGGRVTMGGKLE